MTRLFIRFYLGVLFILFVAWWIQSYIYSRTNQAENARVIEKAFSGGVLLGRDVLSGAKDSQEFEQRFSELRERYEYPVVIVPNSDVPDYAQERFASGEEVVLIGRESAIYIVCPMRNEEEVLQFGPLPEFVGPTQSWLLTGLASVLALAAAAIALLLHPVLRQFRLFERTATVIAQGDYSARVDERKVKSALPLAKSFNNMAEQTESVLRSQRELLQAVSHELRTPLSRIHFAIDLIRDATNEEERQVRLDSLESSSQELDELVGELLHYVRMEASAPKLNRTEAELVPVISDLLEKNAIVYPNIELKLDQQFQSPDITVNADHAGLRRALGNLISNAARFAQTKVVVSVQKSGSAVLIDIDDDGPGIAEADRERVFEPFVRLDESKQGAGLGLALVRRIIASHDGRIEVTKSPLGGCRMHTVWPVDCETQELTTAEVGAATN